MTSTDNQQETKPFFFLGRIRLYTLSVGTTVSLPGGGYLTLCWVPLGALLVGEVAPRAAGVVPLQGVPLDPREAGAGHGHGADRHAGQQLVQEPPAERPQCQRARQVGTTNLTSTNLTYPERSVPLT